MNKEVLIPDIRNKLTPFSNYLEMISSPEYLTNKEFRDLADSEVEKMKVNLAHIVKVMKDFEAKEAEDKWISEQNQSPYPLIDVLKKLTKCADILLHKKDYDGHGWEELEYAYREGVSIIDKISSLPSPPKQ